AVLLNLLAGRLMVEGDLAAAVEAGEQALRIGREHGFDNVISVAANLIASSRLHLSEVDRGLELYELSWEHACDTDAKLRYWVNHSDSLSTLGRYREAL
ncbi:hypothetical protein, partial [Polaribacter sargassicola]|uniref:hypothetical protein n=1 Tax=Polaribacter sargassicola TaxID=2836891 RepID=UPI001F25F87A